MNNIKKMTYSAVLIALAIIIPVAFGFLKVIIPPFTATITAHVPMFISMFLGPVPAIAVGIGSTLGFLLVGSPIYVVARAATHIIVGLIGALLLRKKVSFAKVIVITAPIHGILEVIAVIPFGWTAYQALVVVGVGGTLHHLVDGVISVILIGALSKAMRKDFVKIV